ncbi:MAG: hypothetical protein ACI8RD_002217 [Bacillariaceae sp.]|jgi:hypothetical protein
MKEEVKRMKTIMTNVVGKSYPAATVLVILLFLSLLLTPTLCITSKPLFYEDQIVDHLAADGDNSKYNYPNNNRWTQRYYTSPAHFGGPSNGTIFVIMGGEGAINPTTGIYYPFVANYLAKKFNAYVLQPEHRFYGTSQPLDGVTPISSDQWLRLVNTEQAMLDYVRLIRHIQGELGCSTERTSNEYCPVITVGGSYPGFLSAMMRTVHSDIVDIAYAASAPMKFYDQTVGVNDYYDHITDVAESSSPGCSNDVRTTLATVSAEIQKAGDDGFHSVAKAIGICNYTIPTYVDTSRIFQDELMMIVGYTFANYNMGAYPPGPQTSLYKACQIYQNKEMQPLDKMKVFLAMLDGSNDNKNDRCFFNMSSQLPAGANATITGGDWSGVGTGNSGNIWDVQTCTFNVEKIGFSSRSMFPNRPWTMEWLNTHCAARFGVKPKPDEYRERWRFDDLVNGANASRIIFTNGLRDGWSVGGIKEDLSDSILALNLKTGAHHSELSHLGPTKNDTREVTMAFKKITKIIGSWIDEVKNESSDVSESPQLRLSGYKVVD